MLLPVWFLKSHENEDSEWLEYTNSNPMLAEDKKYAEMESTDSEAEDEKENAANQQAKTWNTTVSILNRAAK